MELIEVVRDTLKRILPMTCAKVSLSLAGDGDILQNEHGGPAFRDPQAQSADDFRRLLLDPQGPLQKWREDFTRGGP